MMRSPIIVLAAVLAVLSTAPRASAARPSAPIIQIGKGAGANQPVSLGVGEHQILKFFMPVMRVAVENPDIADVKVLNGKSIMLAAKAAGTTDLTFWSENDRAQSVTVRVDLAIDGLRQQVRQLYPGKDIQVSSVGDLIVLSGSVDDVRLPSQLEELAKIHGKNVSNLVQVTGSQQVQLEVRFAEVSRSAGRQMGFNLLLRPQGGLGGMYTPNSPPITEPKNDVDVLVQQPPPFAGGYNFMAQVVDTVMFRSILSVLEQNGLMKILAEPTLTTMSGQEANFLAGGEVPIPLSSGLGQVSVNWKRFGILLEFTPTVIDSKTIQLKLSTEVSELDSTLSVSVGGYSIPGFTSRQGGSTVRLSDGQSFAIAGLISEKTRSTIAQVPLLGSIPVLGALFRSTSYQREETELLVIITARLARPLEARELPYMPGELDAHPSDVQLFLFGQDTGGTKPSIQGKTGPAGPMGFFR